MLGFWYVKLVNTEALSLSFFSLEQILYNIKQEYKRMQKRRHLENFQQTDPCCSADAQSQAFLLTGPALPGNVFRIAS